MIKYMGNCVCCRKRGYRYKDGIVIYTTCINANRLQSYDSSRLKYLLNTKEIPYIEIKMDLLMEEDKFYMKNYILTKTGEFKLPLLFVDDDLIGDYRKLQDLEDHGEMTPLLLK